MTVSDRDHCPRITCARIERAVITIARRRHEARRDWRWSDRLPNADFLRALFALLTSPLLALIPGPQAIRAGFGEGAAGGADPARLEDNRGICACDSPAFCGGAVCRVQFASHDDEPLCKLPIVPAYHTPVTTSDTRSVLPSAHPH